MDGIIQAVLVVGITGLIFGILLSIASVIFAVKKDERIDLIEEALPGANCGACGCAGCSAYAAEIVSNGAPMNLCSVGKAPVAKRIGEIMGRDAGKVEEKVAKVMCQGDCTLAEDKYIYEGIANCNVAIRLGGGAKVCRFGCLGLGTCAEVCEFDAIEIINGIAVINEEKCTGCGKCKNACPKKIIELVPKTSTVYVLCSNKDKGPAVNKYCKVSCIGCGICKKNCPQGAISVVDNVATIDYSKCTGCGICAEKCPKKVIKVKNG